MKKQLSPWGCRPLPQGYIHVYDHYFQTSSSIKQLGQSMPNFTWSLLEKPSRENKVYINGPGYMTKMAAMSIYGKNLQKYSPTELSPMIMKLGMEHYVHKLYKVYLNDDPELTMTYFTIMSNLAKLVFVLIASPDIR